VRYGSEDAWDRSRHEWLTDCQQLHAAHYHIARDAMNRGDVQLARLAQRYAAKKSHAVRVDMGIEPPKPWGER